MPFVGRHLSDKRDLVVGGRSIPGAAMADDDPTTGDCGACLFCAQSQTCMTSGGPEEKLVPSPRYAAVRNALRSASRKSKFDPSSDQPSPNRRANTFTPF